MFNDMYFTVPPKKNIKKTKQLIEWMYNIIAQINNINVSYVFILTHYLGLKSKEPNQWRIGRHLSLCHTVSRTFDKIQPNLF